MQGLRLILGIVVLAGMSCYNVAGGRRKPSPKPYSECDEPSDEFFYLVQQWPPGFCSQEECPRAGPSTFTIHGFWPNYCQAKSGKEYPQFCSGEKLELDTLSDLLPRMEKTWISLTNHGDKWFWEHEWDKHGTCALAYTQFGLNNQHDYFETTLQLAEATDLYEVLASQSITPGGEYAVSEIQSALISRLGGDVFLNCEKGNVLVEIYVCYNQQLERVACSKRGDCSTSQNVKFVASESRNFTDAPEL